MKSKIIRIKPRSSIYHVGGRTKIRHADYGGSVEEWKRIRKIVLARDNYRCCICGTSQAELKKWDMYLEVDHRRMVAHGGTDNVSNLWSICPPCHSRRPNHSHLKAKIRSKVLNKIKVQS